MGFDGFSEAALDFYDDLEADNTKTFWVENRHRYDELIAAPMRELAEAVTAEFGQPKIFRPYRDVRFARDKTPYKTHQGLFIGVAPATGYYLELSAAGILTGAGFYEANPARLASWREAIDHETYGAELDALLAAMQTHGWSRGGNRLKTAPRGFDTDHPRIDLLRHRSLNMFRNHGFGPDVIGTPNLLELVRDDWRQTEPLVDWISLHVRG